MVDKRYILLNERYDIYQCNLTVLGSLEEGICCTSGQPLFSTILKSPLWTQSGAFHFFILLTGVFFSRGWELIAAMFIFVIATR